MSTRKVASEAYIQFLIGTQVSASALEGERVEIGEHASHDSVTRFLQRGEEGAEELWNEAKEFVVGHSGVLVIDDSTLDKPYASSKMELVCWHWSGKHHRVVKGINVVSLLWTDGDSHIPCDYGVYDKEQGRTKNQIFQDMISRVRSRGVTPSYVLFDSWYGSAENLRIIGMDYGWKFLTRLKANRKVRVKEGYESVSTLPEGEHEVHLKDFGMIKVFVVTQHDETQYWATNDLFMDELTRIKYADCGWNIEEYHRGLKQYCHIERCQHRSRTAQITHIGLAIRAFLRLERYCYSTGYSWMHAKLEIVRDAVRNYLRSPSITFYSTA